MSKHKYWICINYLILMFLLMLLGSWQVVAAKSSSKPVIHKRPAEVVTADGFSFELQPQEGGFFELVGVGGPCRTVGYDLLKIDLFGAAYVVAKNEVSVTVASMPGGGVQREQYIGRGKSYSSENCFGDQGCIERWACLETAHGQYLVAVENWVHANKSLIDYEFKQFLKKNPNHYNPEFITVVQRMLSQ